MSASPMVLLVREGRRRVLVAHVWRRVVCVLGVISVLAVLLSQYTDLTKPYARSEREWVEANFIPFPPLPSSSQQSLKNNASNDDNERKHMNNSNVDKKNNRHLNNNNGGTNNRSNKNNNILVLASSGRSGSSFLGELVASQAGNIYFFEPERTLNLDYNQLTGQTAREELRRLYTCNMRPDMVNSRYNQFADSAIRLSSRLRCNDEFWIHEDFTRIRAVCMQVHIRVVKTVRVRLAWVLPLLDEVNLKIVHLVRDPRGTSVSKSNYWNTNEDDCVNIAEDLKAKEVLEKRYPKQYLFIRYEDLCLHTHTKARELYHFLLKDPASEGNEGGGGGGEEENKEGGRVEGEGEEDLPVCVEEFLESHTHFKWNQLGMYSTYRDTSSVYQEWRDDITESALVELETRCADVLDSLGYKIFGNLAKVQNLSIPLLVP